jgi:hypothetical protein
MRNLPDNAELQRQLAQPGATLAKVGARYGVTRQAVWKMLHPKQKTAAAA